MSGGLITSFIDKAMKEVQIEQSPSGYYYAEIPSCEGVWATGDTSEECIRTLQEVLEDWLYLKLRDGDKDFPVYRHLNVNVDKDENP